MPPKAASTPSPPQLLSPGKHALFWVLLPLVVTLLIFGSAGLIVLLDDEGQGRLGATEFGLMFKKIIAINPFFCAVFFNGGLVGTIYVASKLLDHRKAVKLAAVKKDKTGKKETKKEQ